VKGYFTGDDGATQAWLTLGKTAGAVSVQASYPNVPSVIFTATALPGRAAKLQLVSGDGQTGIVGNPLPQPFKTKVADAFGNGLPNFNVIYSVTNGGGSFNGADRITVLTNSNGIAQATLTLGAIAGLENNQVEASAVDGSNPLTGSPVRFKASAENKTSVELLSFAVYMAKFNGIRLEWQTASEAQNAGFNVLRSLSKDAGYKKINDDLIRTQQEGKYNFEDKDVNVGVRYYYLIEDVDLLGVITLHGPVSATVEPPAEFVLDQNYPNPFNPSTTIRYQTPANTYVTLRVFDLQGKVVRVLVDEEKPAGYHTVVWDSRNERGARVSSGVYWYQFKAGRYVSTMKMILAK
jgi:hypothetical protein